MRALGVVLAVAIAGCGGGQLSAFGYHFADNQEADLSAALRRLPAPAPDRPRNGQGPIVVASTHSETPAERRLIAARLPEAQQLWSVAFDAETRPEILGDVVVSTTREHIVAFDLESGRELWRHELPDLGYVGAARDGDTIFWAATVGALGGARREGHVVAMNARDGGTLWRHRIEGVFGRPAAAGGLVFVPWERQNIGILEGATGVEIARLRSTDDVIAWAFDHPSGVYYGGRGVYRLDARSASGTRAGSTYLSAPLGELPRQPESIWPDGFVPQPGERSARGRIRVYFTPAVSDAGIGVEGETYYFAYYRYVFAFSADGTLRWTRNLEQDVISAQALPNGLLTVGEQGRVLFLDREHGNDRWAGELGAQLAAVDLDAAGFDAGEAAEARPLRASLNEIVLDPDNRLVAARAYAVAQLARIEDPEVTRDLLDLYQQRSMPSALKEAIREALRTRRSGEQYLMEALARRYDYLEDTQAPPLEAIVPALLEMQHAAAVPRLVNHLMDHETPEAVLPQLVEAIVRLGGEEAVPALRNFVTLYQADSTFAGAVADQPAREGHEAVRASPAARAIALASQGIFEHGGEEGRQLCASMSAEGARMHQPLAEHVQSLFEAERQARARAEQEQQAAAQAALAEQQRQVEAALPRRLTQDQINATFAENADRIRECIAGELERNPRLAQVRLVFILAREGTASDVTVSPNTPELVSCLQERVAQIQFPRFTQRMMRGVFTVGVRGAAQEEETQEPVAAPIPDDAPWWAWVQRRAELGGIANAFSYEEDPWWSEREPPARPAQPAIVQAPPEVEEELPPGMVARQPQPRQQPAQQQPAQQQPAQQPAQQQPAEGGGTPWWAGAASEETEEEEEEQPEEPRPRPRPRRRQR